MPTPGPWQAEMQLTIPGTVLPAGRFRWGLNATDAHYPGQKNRAEVNALVNGRRLTTDGGSVGSATVGDRTFGAECVVRVFSEAEIDGTFVDTGEAFDQGWWISANLVDGWASYTDTVAVLAFEAGASSYEIEGSSLLHIVSVDSAHAEIPLTLFGTDAPLLAIRVDTYTGPADDYTTPPSAPTLRDTRDLETSYAVGSGGGEEALTPLVLNLSPPAFHPAFGGFHLYPISRQALVEDWDTGGYAGRGELFPRILMYADGTVTLTYDVTFPRYRFLFDEEIPTTEPSVTRQWPRDDALGSMGSGTRIYPPPRRGRVYPAQQ